MIGCPTNRERQTSRRFVQHTDAPCCPAPARLRLPLPRVRYRRRAVGGRCADPWRRSAPVIDLAQSSDGKWSGSAILPGFGIKGAPLADLSVTDSAVNFSLAGVFGDPTEHITGAGFRVAGWRVAQGSGERPVT